MQNILFFCFNFYNLYFKFYKKIRLILSFKKKNSHFLLLRSIFLRMSKNFINHWNQSLSLSSINKSMINCEVQNKNWCDFNFIIFDNWFLLHFPNSNKERRFHERNGRHKSVFKSKHSNTSNSASSELIFFDSQSFQIYS